MTYGNNPTPRDPTGTDPHSHSYTSAIVGVVILAIIAAGAIGYTGTWHDGVSPPPASVDVPQKAPVQ